MNRQVNIIRWCLHHNAKDRPTSIDLLKCGWLPAERSYRWLWEEYKEHRGVNYDVLEMDHAFEEENAKMIASIKHSQKDRGIAEKKLMAALKAHYYSNEIEK
ncbi:hypothetical protein C2G38_2154461 [Gigaspora rosea]|uniref:Uncharacterized protein n=1 Tax=Gigaspora rosea TaxID=44941 RepID=A0A397W4Z0_9GLOM|nr:hypothetical protein C2G38_2154461 [Gigaspora rosea]